MTTRTHSTNGAAPRNGQFFDVAAEEVAGKYRQFMEDDADAGDDDVDFIDDSGEDAIPTPCTSITAAYFAVDPRPPLIAYICKPRDTRQFFLASRDVQRRDVHRYSVFLARTRQGKLHLLLVRRPTLSGNDFPAWTAVRRLARRAQKAGGWWGMAWEEQVNGRFKLRGGPCPNVTDAVTFPETSLEELVMLAFEDRTIEDANDPRLPELPDLSDAPELA
jgi:hypothetical protein